MTSVTITIHQTDESYLNKFLAQTKISENGSHGPLTIETLVDMLLQDVALMISRPGSWEGSNMSAVMASHGYGDNQCCGTGSIK